MFTGGVLVFLCQAGAASQKQDASANDPLAQCSYSSVFTAGIVTPRAATKYGKAGQAGIKGIAEGSYPFTYASFSVIFPPRTVKMSTPRRCHGWPFRTFR